MGIGDRVRQLRDKAGLSQEELAKQIDLSVGHTSKLERNKHDPSLATLRRLTHVFRLKTWEELLGPVDGVQKTVSDLEHDALAAAAIAHHTPIGSPEREHARRLFRLYAEASGAQLEVKPTRPTKRKRRRRVIKMSDAPRKK